MRIIRAEEWADPTPHAVREVISALPDEPTEHAPVLFVPGFGGGAWVYAEHWLAHAASRGVPAYAMSPRGHGASGAAPKAGLRAYTHDVVQVAAALPRQAVLVGHGAGALVVAEALSRYPARAAVLLAPVFGGWGAAFGAWARNPFGVTPAIFGAALRPRRGQLFSAETPVAQQREYVSRRGRAASRAQWELARHGGPEQPVGEPPVLVVGSPDDRLVPAKELERVARRYRGSPLLFPGMGHDLMLDASWREPLDAVLDWLEKNP